MPPLKECLITPDDVCIETDGPLSLSFTVNGVPCYIVKKTEYKCIGCLKNANLVTHRISELTTYGDGYFICSMTGSDGSQLPFFLTVSDLRHNLDLASESADVQTAELPV